ncbi:MAG: transporter [Beduini sp.]|uniref:transporter n=1 Tax=Beduini sp. TaxID=1922300 RepID=UPI0011C74CFD
MKTKPKFKNIIILQLVIIIYSLSSVCAKFASNEAFLSPKFVLFYGIEILILGIYAILWQQVIKHFDLSIAYANRATGLLWSVIFALFIFKENITVMNIVGIGVAICGIILVNLDEHTSPDTDH